ICALVFRFYVPGVVREMADTLAAGGNFNIGKFRFTVRGVEIPKTKYLFFAGELQPVPWERVQCKGRESLVAALQDSADPAVSNYEPFSTANACAIEPLVQFMQQSPIGKGPWYLARNKQKVGPFSWTQLQQMAASGMLQPADMLWPEGAAKWAAASSIPGLF